LGAGLRFEDGAADGEIQTATESGAKA